MNLTNWHFYILRAKLTSHWREVGVFSWFDGFFRWHLYQPMSFRPVDAREETLALRHPVEHKMITYGTALMPTYSCRMTPKTDLHSIPQIQQTRWSLKWRLRANSLGKDSGQSRQECVAAAPPILSSVISRLWKINLEWKLNDEKPPLTLSTSRQQ